MARIRVVTDSTADMDEEEARRLGIEMVPLSVTFGAEVYQDKVDITVDEFYRKLREESGTPRTSQPPSGRFEEMYRDLLAGADGVVSVHISSDISGTFNSAQAAAQAVDPERIAVVDSRILSYPLGELAIQVARIADEGASLSDCVALAGRLVPRLRLIAAMDTLEYLRRGGRIGRAQAFAGTILSIKPIVHLVDGHIVPADRVRTRAAAVKRTAELVLALGPLEAIAVLHADDPTPADQVEALIRQALPHLQIKRGRTGSVIGTHTGPGTFGVSAIVAE